jgi:hypothetical protein
MKCRTLLLAVIAAGACADSNSMHGPPMKARPAGCAVSFFTKTQPTYEYVDIATVRTRCRYSTDRIGCADELRSKACALGGDTVYGFARAATRDHTLVSARIAYRRGGAVDVSARQPQCMPACGSGMKCEEGECVPSCSPNCSPAQLCQARHTCGTSETPAEPEAVSPSP